MTPNHLQLTTPQLAVLDRLSFGRSDLISGPPGSGKSTLALHWAAMTALDGERVQIITRSRLLAACMQTRLGWLTTNPDVRVATAHEWLRKRFGHSFSDSEDGWPDWDQLDTRSSDRPGPVIVVDEGQDLPPEIYRHFRKASSQVTVFADECQQLGHTQSTLDEIHQEIGADGVVTVEGNHRVPSATAELITWLGVIEPSRSCPARGTRPSIRAVRDLGGLVDLILALYLKHRGKSIGIVFESGDQHEHAEVELRRRGRHLNPQSYRSLRSGPLRIDPTRPGLFLVNRRSVKGLEFDVVVIADAHTDSWRDPTGAELRLTYSMLAARTRDQLHLCYQGSSEPPLLARLPESVVDRDRNQAI